MTVRIATGAVRHIGGSEILAADHVITSLETSAGASYHIMNLFSGRILGRCRVQPEPRGNSGLHATHHPAYTSCNKRRLRSQANGTRLSAGGSRRDRPAAAPTHPNDPGSYAVAITS
ncbi:hypothetical protein EVAR_16444_1 [Eumeta japonica]|uniref:Uncharacterized protein n=1 Tax=Eumeta variegata TaxID=151549 RepID=A0A4C1ULW9_EUMVA|nr:hypothetical protein EVAR_16444_1 [Eumeta japonica]